MNTFYRDLRETRQKWDSVGSEIKRKDNQIRELQQRLEVNEGCKCCIFNFHFVCFGLGIFLFFRYISLSIYLSIYLSVYLYIFNFDQTI